MSKKIKSIKTGKGRYPNSHWKIIKQKKGRTVLLQPLCEELKKGGICELRFYTNKVTIEYEPEKFAVHTPTQADFDELMRLYEIAGWKWTTGRKPSESQLEVYRGVTITFGDYFNWGVKCWFVRDNYTILNLSEARQKLQEMYPDKDFSKKSKKTVTLELTDEQLKHIKQYKEKTIKKIKYFCKKLKIDEPKNWNYREVKKVSDLINSEMKKREKICPYCYGGVILPDIICPCEIKYQNN